MFERNFKNLTFYLKIYNNEIIKNFKSYNLKTTRILPLRLTGLLFRNKVKGRFYFCSVILFQKLKII